MTARRRILVLQIATLAVVIAAVAMSYAAFRASEHFTQRIDAVQRRFEVLAELIGLTHNYGEEVAKVMLMGREASRDLSAARIELERAFARLSVVTRAEFATIGQAGLDRELRELENTRRMVELYHAIDRTAARALTLARDSLTTEALAVFEREVAFRLSNELQPLLESSLAGERATVSDQLSTITATQNAYLMAGGGLGALALVILGLMSWGLHRAMGRESAALSAQVAASSEELKAANERLRDIDSRRSEFFADVSHELRTPLTILRGEADVALREPATPEAQRESLELIRGQAVELGRLLDELIAFARSEADAQDYVMAPTRIDLVAAAAVQEGEVLANTREIALGMTLGDNGALVEADFRRLKQALIIGLDNAVKHSPPGSRIELFTAREGSDVALTIDDEGPGIAPGDEMRVFERFYRGAATDTQGLGIGLAIARGIVERHGGRISIANRPGGGARLRISLPASGSAS